MSSSSSGINDAREQAQRLIAELRKAKPTPSSSRGGSASVRGSREGSVKDGSNIPSPAQGSTPAHATSKKRKDSTSTHPPPCHSPPGPANRSESPEVVSESYASTRKSHAPEVSESQTSPPPSSSLATDGVKATQATTRSPCHHTTDETATQSNTSITNFSASPTRLAGRDTNEAAMQPIDSSSTTRRPRRDTTNEPAQQPSTGDTEVSNTRSPGRDTTDEAATQPISGDTDLSTTTSRYPRDTNEAAAGPLAVSRPSTSTPAPAPVSSASGLAATPESAIAPPTSMAGSAPAPAASTAGAGALHPDTATPLRPTRMLPGVSAKALWDGNEWQFEISTGQRMTKGWRRGGSTIPTNTYTESPDGGEYVPTWVTNIPMALGGLLRGGNLSRLGSSRYWTLSWIPDGNCECVKRGCTARSSSEF